MARPLVTDEGTASRYGWVAADIRSSFKTLLKLDCIINRTVNKDMHIDFLRRLRDAVRRKRPEK